MNVQELTDAELNRAMIWLYPPRQTCIDDDGVYTGFIGVKGVGYLQDWNLTMPLAVENKLCLDMEGAFWTFDGLTYIGANEVCNPDGSITSYNDNPLRAICEVLVMIKLEQPL